MYGLYGVAAWLAVFDTSSDLTESSASAAAAVLCSDCSDAGLTASTSRESVLIVGVGELRNELRLTALRSAPLSVFISRLVVETEADDTDEAADLFSAFFLPKNPVDLLVVSITGKL